MSAMGLILYEDEHVLAANKPAGWNTHAPSPYAGEGLYEWLKTRERDRARLAILHRLDKETSGVIVFGKSTAANRSLARQFEERRIEKKYLLWTTARPDWRERRVRSSLARAGETYAVRPGEEAETAFLVAGEWPGGAVIEARPMTGRTHQIRAHAAHIGCPILGDVAYGGERYQRMCLHSTCLRCEHPVSGDKLEFCAPAEFTKDRGTALREAIIDGSQTDAYRMIHGAADGWPGLYADRLGDYLLAQSAGAIESGTQEIRNKSLREFLSSKFESSQGAFFNEPCRGIYHKILRQEGQAAPELLRGEAAPDGLVVRENGVRFALHLGEGYSHGLFLDQRDNRRRLLRGYVGPGFEIARPFELLNVFAYTCGFSVCGAMGGGRVTSLDLSRNYLAWGKRNFELNGIDPAAHEFLYGDAFDWLRRLVKKKRLFDVVILDPPTFSRSRESGVFQIEKDLGKLTALALPLLKPNGILFASTNAATFAPEDFLGTVSSAITGCRWRIRQQQYVPQPPDFPVDRAEPAYLKTVWLRLSGQ